MRKPHNTLRISLTILLVLISRLAMADISLPSVLSDGMVLRQRSAVRIWGWGNPTEKVNIQPSWETAKDTAVVKGNGKWSFTIHTPAAGGPYTIRIDGRNTIILKDILIGEVWICSGQSNMDMSMNWGLKYDDDIPKTDNDSVRLLQVPKLTASFPAESINAKWEKATPKVIRSFSAVGYFFAVRLQKQLHVPVGIINASWGGSAGEPFLPGEAIRTDTALNNAANKLRPNKYASTEPGEVFNAMIYPLKDLPVTGILWYQGEANVGQHTYKRLLTTLIRSWRELWNEDMPFYYVQIAPWSGYGKKLSGALIREDQSKVLSVQKTGMVLTMDLVDDITDLHPKRKKEVGLRLGDLALGDHYGIRGLTYMVPQYDSFRIDGNKMTLSFKHTENGLSSQEKNIRGFYISGKDKTFVPANAEIKGNSVVVWNDDIKHPKAVRYAFSGDATATLFSKKGLPVNLFRTDDWPIDTIKQ
ncbi:sialate O-acetylesterase [Mucilaginibacter dorajii]|nr:sialate O-acetylesterase [Mucilaginibacter dorajii]MCS3732436.1 sialate O-acetylesterase [Mucilaginibacter dorajii]